MRAIICHSAKDLRIETTELPALGSDQVRVKVAFGGICGSDLHYYQHGGFGTVRIKQPMALGHEISGVVDALAATTENAGVARGQPGQVAAEQPLIVIGVGELDPVAGKRQRDLRHAHTLGVGAP